MSHAYGYVLCKDGTKFHYEYNGTSDVTIPMLRNSPEEVSKYWRNGEWRYCSAPKEHQHEDVQIYTSYGDGFHWPGKICRQCMCITDGFEPDYDNEFPGEPE